MQARNMSQQGHVPHAVMAGSVRAGDAGPVQQDRDACPVQADIHKDLVEGAVEEGGVQSDHRAHPGEGEPSSEGERVLLGDTDIDDALGQGVGKWL